MMSEHTPTTPPAPPAEKKRRAPGTAPPKPRTRPQRWGDALQKARDALAKMEEQTGDFEAAIADLEELRNEYEEWYDRLNEGGQAGPTGQKLEAVKDLEIEDVGTTLTEAISEAGSKLDDLEGAELPLGYGKD